MSLINDALKRARLQAARQQGGRLPTPYGQAPTHMPPISRLSPIALPSVALLVVVAVFATTMIVREPAPTTGDDRVRELAAAQPTADAPSAVTDPARTIDDSTVAAPSAPPVEAVDVSPALAAEPLVPATELALDEPAAAPSAGAVDASTEPIAVRPMAAPPDEVSTLDGMSFLKVAILPGGGRLELSGIAWSGARPVAVISGNVVSQGELVEGFTVVGIEQSAVQLRGLGSTFSIRLR